jgi:hypothetical protein
MTLGADVGGFGDELYFYWVVCAWGLHARGQLIDLGLARSRDEMRTQLLTSKYPHADGGPPLQLVQAGVDSGSFTQSIYEFCRGVPGLWPIKGSSRNQDSPWTRATFNEMFQGGMQRAGLDPKFVQQKQKAGAYDLLLPHTQRSQDWIVERLEGRVKRDHANAFTIPAEAFGQVVPGVDLAKHLLGDYEDNGIWRKRYEDQDFRDALRYAVIVAWFYTANGAIWAALPPRGSAAHPPAPTRSGDQRGRRGGFVRQRSGGRR